MRSREDDLVSLIDFSWFRVRLLTLILQLLNDFVKEKSLNSRLLAIFNLSNLSFY